METLTFELRLANGAKNHFVVAAGGADGDHDGTVEDPGEVGAFTPQVGGLWTRTQSVQLPTAGMLFAVTFTVGTGVAWQLTIKNSAGTTLFSSASTTIFPFDTVSSRL